MSFFNVLRRSRVRRDIKTRKAVAMYEVLRQAYRYIIRNETIPMRARIQAQLELNDLPRETRSTTIKNRCTETGRGRAVFRDSRLCRYQFRLKALNADMDSVNLNNSSNITENESSSNQNSNLKGSNKRIDIIEECDKRNAEKEFLNLVIIMLMSHLLYLLGEADAAVLVIDATVGEFEAGFDAKETCISTLEV
ncbi:3366_t:CDS:2 [Entrophospora sp. SA101]|nr:19474_t:CDS:2 [Entrophospora sp. SA101]CAJ0910234.1 3366_t:CDS:2 [Entrophospora sp. SA101]